MSDPVRWRRHGAVELRCDELVHSAAVSPDDVYVATVALDRCTVTITHRESADTVAVIPGPPVASMAWCSVDHLAIVRELKLSLLLAVHELPDGGVVGQHRFERPGAGGIELLVSPAACAAVVLCLSRKEGVTGTCQRVESFSGARLEGRRTVALDHVQTAALLALPEARAAALSPDGDSLALCVSTPRFSDARLVVVSLLDGAAVGSTADVPHLSAAPSWVSPTRLIALCAADEASTLLRIDTSDRRVFARPIGARVISHDVHPSRDRLLVTARVRDAERPALLAAELPIDTAYPAEFTLRWRVDARVARSLRAAWDARGAMVTASFAPGRVVRLTRWDDDDAPVETSEHTLDTLGGKLRRLEFEPTASRRVMRLTAWLERDGQQAARESLFSV